MKNKKAAKTETKKTAAQIKEERAVRMREINRNRKTAAQQTGKTPATVGIEAAKADDETSQAKAEKRTIKQLVIESFGRNVAIGDDELIAAVKKEFPASAFSKTHSAWYRAQARKGLLTGTPIAIPRPARKTASVAAKS